MAKTATARKPKGPPAAEHVEAASKTSSIKHLVWLADAFHRVGSRGVYETKMPWFGPGEVTGKGYRRFNLPIDTALECDSMRIGARDGLIFRFRPKVGIKRKSSQGGDEMIEAVEMKWLDVCNTFEDLADKIEERIRDVRQVELKVDDLDKEIKSLIAKNPQMHPIIVEGFKKAQDMAKEQANDSVLEHIDGFGSF